MLIQILGAGCARCKLLHETATKAVQESGVAAQIEKVEDIHKIMDLHILMLPGLVIDGAVKAAGRLPEVGEVIKMIQFAQKDMI